MEIIKEMKPIISPSACLIKDLQRQVNDILCPCGKIKCEGYRRRQEYLLEQISFSEIVLHTLPIISKFLTL